MQKPKSKIETKVKPKNYLLLLWDFLLPPQLLYSQMLKDIRGQIEGDQRSQFLSVTQKWFPLAVELVIMP